MHDTRIHHHPICGVTPMKKINTKFGTAYDDNKGYYVVPGKGRLHRLVWEDWYNKPVPKGYVIHHINYNPLDNRIQNLQCVESTLHRKHHGNNLSEEQKQVLLEYAKKPKSEEHKSNLSKARNSSGYVNVSKHHSKKYKQGFMWRYNYSEKGKRYEIQRVKLEDLEREVKRRNLKWERISDDDVV